MTRSSSRIKNKGEIGLQQQVNGGSSSNIPNDDKKDAVKKLKGRQKRAIEEKPTDSVANTTSTCTDGNISDESLISPQKKQKQMPKKENNVNPEKTKPSDSKIVNNSKNSKKGKKKNSKQLKNVKDEPIDVDNDVIANGTSIDVKSDNIANGSSVKDEPLDADLDSKSNKKKSKAKAKIEKPVKTAVERPMIKKGLAAVDGLCPIAQTSHVFCEGNTTIWDCMLNQTNIQFNNNKFYLIQLLKDDSKNIFNVWMRWARVGANGQNSLTACGSDLEKAKKIFCKKFDDKTKNDWEERDCFEKVPGKYDLLKMDYSNATDEVDATVKKEEKKPLQLVDCKLEIRVRALIDLICDVKAMEDAVVEMKYDAKKAPLGKLTIDQVKAGYAALKKIDDCIGGSGKNSNKNLLYACNDFYTRIPHYFGMRVPPLISTKKEVKEKMDLLDALGDIQAAMSVIGQQIDVTMHPSDQHYKGLGCNIEVVEKGTPRFKLLSDYLHSTHGKTHTFYTLEILEIYQVDRPVETERFKDFGNNTLLWHGSRLTNWAGILSQGLRIAPPEAPCTGYMFGKGLYFADMCSKSANYCNATRLNNTGLLTLSKVSLGYAPNKLYNADMNAHKLPAGSYAVKAMGKMAPDPMSSNSLPDGTIVPMGPGVETKIENPKGGFTLQYNEYIVYDIAQVKMQFLFKVKFHFK